MADLGHKKKDEPSGMCTCTNVTILVVVFPRDERAKKGSWKGGAKNSESRPDGPFV